MKHLLTSLLLILTVSPLAQAKHDRGYHNNDKQYRKELKAKVISYTPIYKYVNVKQQQRYNTHSDYRTHGQGAAIIGGIVGGFIGHASSDDKHKGLATLAGAIIGSSLAHNIKQTSNKYSHHNQVEPISNIPKHKKVNKVRVLEGYNVTYRSQGKIHTIFSQDKPTKYIRINY